MIGIAACAVAFNITVASMAAEWPRGADATVASMLVPWPEPPDAMPEWSEAWVAAQMAPRRLYRAAQHPSARTWQVCQWAASRASDRYAFDPAAFRERLARDPLGLGYPDDLGDWPAEARRQWLAQAREASEAIICESDGLLGADRLADGPDDFGADWADWNDSPPPKNGETKFETAEMRGEGGAARKPKFQLVAYDAITFASDEEWRVKRLFPTIGVGSLYGPSRTFKTFILTDVFLHIASGADWGGRKVKQGAVVYVAAEGAGGIRKRIAGWKMERGEGLPTALPFYLVTVAPNLGTGDADLKELIASIEAVGVTPCAIALDTLAQSLGGADENNVGMASFVTNATALANHFQCFVPAVHHTPLSDDKRLRGNTTLIGGLDVAVLAEREEGALAAVLTIKKLKDEEDGQKITVCLGRVSIGVDEDGEDVSTLVVQSVQPGAVEGAKARLRKSIPRSMQMLVSVIQQAIVESEAPPIRPVADGPLVKAVSDDVVRHRYYLRMADKARPDDTPKKFADRRRTAFNRAVEGAIKHEVLMACDVGGGRFLWMK